MASTPAMNVVLTAPNPGISTPSFPDGASILTPFWTTIPPKRNRYISDKKAQKHSMVSSCLVFPASWVTSLSPTRLQIVTIHARYDFKLDFLWTDGFAFADVRAAAEQLLFDLRHHVQGALIPFGLALRQESEMADLRSCEQCRSRVRARRDTSTAADAGCSVHCEVGVLLRYQNRIPIPRAARPSGNEPARCDDPVKRAAIDNKIFHNRKRSRAPRFEVENVAVFEVTHMELADRRGRLRTVSYPVDHESAHTANSFAAVVIK